jgi:hypothetical protein
MIIMVVLGFIELVVGLVGYSCIWLSWPWFGGIEYYCSYGVLFGGQFRIE